MLFRSSYLLPAWFLGLFPEKKIIQTAHTAELAVGFGRKVRNLVSSPAFQDVFDTTLSTDSKAAGRWNTGAGGDYFAIGVGGAVTGKGADLLIIDDPHSEQEAKLGNPAVYDSVYEWYTSGPRQRLQPGGAIIIVMCMTGDTNVLMADGTTQQLKNIKVGDQVATFDGGKLSKSKVNNWRSSGVDSIYKIQTQSGRILRANERHPFLVMNEGVLEWTRLKYLKPGDLLVSLKGAIDHQGQKQSLGNVHLAKQVTVTTEKTQTHQESQLVTMGNGWVNSVSAVSQSIAKACAQFVTGGNTTLQNKLLNKTVQGASNTGMASLLSSTKQWLQNVTTYVTFANSRQREKTPVLTGVENSASTTTTPQVKSGGYSATIATSDRKSTRLNSSHT